jgi:hypothetical protein
VVRVPVVKVLAVRVPVVRVPVVKVLVVKVPVVKVLLRKSLWVRVHYSVSKFRCSVSWFPGYCGEWVFES